VAWPAAAGPGWPLCRAYGAGIIVTGVNPSVVILFAVTVPPFVDRAAGHVPAQIAVLGLALLALTLPFDLMYVIAGEHWPSCFSGARRSPAICKPSSARYSSS
jgi:threonine/homoserine/homoserine lactone efflux protein